MQSCIKKIDLALKCTKLVIQKFVIKINVSFYFFYHNCKKYTVFDKCVKKIKMKIVLNLSMIFFISWQLQKYHRVDSNIKYLLF